MTSILSKICDYKKEFIDHRKKVFPESEIIKNLDNRYIKRDFKLAIDKNYHNNNISIIAEIKRASPSKGIIVNDFDPKRIALSYEKGGATCISVLTDEKYFLGNDKNLTIVRKHCLLPIIRKDFIISEYQIYESKYIGADCILLIHSILDKFKIIEFYKLAKELKLDVLIEVHNQEELDNVSEMEGVLIGINNRNLNTMKVHLNNSINIKNKLKSDINLICESGIGSIDDIKTLLKFKFRTFLIGEYLMRCDKPDKALNDIFKLNKKE